MSRRITCVLTTVARSLLVTLAVFGLLAGTLGVPLPTITLSRKDLSVPFPCMDRQCGCRTADQCWQSCCCFTNRQKLAWAKKKGVMTPEFVEFAAEREEADEFATACCASPSKEKQAVCEVPGEGCCEELDTQPTLGVTLVLAIHSRQCRGQSGLWLALGAAAPLPASVEMESPLVPFGETCILIPRLLSIYQLPATPPPRA